MEMYVMREEKMITPKNRIIIVKLLEDTDEFFEHTTILKAKSHQDISQHCEVVAIATSCRQEGKDLKIGDHILIDIEMEEIKLHKLWKYDMWIFYLRENDVICVIENCCAKKEIEKGKND